MYQNETKSIIGKSEIDVYLDEPTINDNDIDDFDEDVEEGDTALEDFLAVTTYFLTKSRLVRGRPRWPQPRRAESDSAIGSRHRRFCGTPGNLGEDWSGHQSHGFGGWLHIRNTKGPNTWGVLEWWVLRLDRGVPHVPTYLGFRGVKVNVVLVSGKGEVRMVAEPTCPVSASLGPRRDRHKG
ncbi:hypothetical protein CR513_54697, partial [Mucuna pruriens]